MEIRLFSDKSLLGDIPYKLGDFAVFFTDKGVNCYININGNKSEDDIIKAIMHKMIDTFEKSIESFSIIGALASKNPKLFCFVMFSISSKRSLSVKGPVQMIV